MKTKQASRYNKLTHDEVGAKHGFRSGLENQEALRLDKLGVNYEYEKLKIKYVVPETIHTYTVDFELLDNHIIIETKGQFKLEDRKKHKWVKEQHPELDIRFVFCNSKTRLGKARRLKDGTLKKQMTYGQWCEKHGFLYADKEIPKEWLKEKPKNVKKKK